MPRIGKLESTTKMTGAAKVAGAEETLEPPVVKRVGRWALSWALVLTLVVGLMPLPVGGLGGQAVAAKGASSSVQAETSGNGTLAAGSVDLKAHEAQAKAASGSLRAAEVATPTALLAADGKLYSCTSAGKSTGALLKIPASTSANASALASQVLAQVQTLFVASNVKRISPSFAVTTTGNPAAVSGRMGQMTSLAKVVFLASRAANSTAVAKARKVSVAATKNKSAANRKLKKAKAKYARLKSSSKKASTWKKQGSLGFFQYYANVKGEAGAKAAVRALKRQGYSKRDTSGKAFNSYTKYGGKNDATNLANFERAVKHIPRGNKLRTTDNHFRGLKNLLVSDVIMAMAQNHANWSAAHLNHAGNCGSDYPVGENLAWNYGSDPYYQWYTTEKLAYEGKRVDQVGHYLNIVEPWYSSTGYAINTAGTMNGWTTYCQQFGIGPVAGEKLYTPTQYLKRIRAYKKWLSSATKQVVSAKKAYKGAQVAAKESAVKAKSAQAELKAQQSKSVNACTAVSAGTFAGCKKLTKVQGFNSTLAKSIGKNAFKGCGALASCKFPYATLTSVEAGAFSGCKRLAVKPTVSVKAKAKVTRPTTQKFRNYKAVKPVSKVTHKGKKLRYGTDFTLRYTNNTCKGTAKVAVIGKGKYYGVKTVSFKIR